jgi:hypothetical protein
MGTRNAEASLSRPCRAVSQQVRSNLFLSLNASMHAKELGLKYNVESFRRWKPTRVRIFILQAEDEGILQQHDLEPLNKSERFRRSTLCWKSFMLYYNHLRRWA